MRLNQLLRLTVSAAVILGTGAGVAYAQDSGDEPTRVDDIIVTAQKREQSLQDVPIVVTTLSEELLEDAGVRDIKDLQILTPGLTVTSTTNESITTARIRGVGTVGDNPGLESSVGVVIDGIYRPRNGVGFGDLGELQRIEVLKGPQGTLFGRNTSAGVINIITERPSFTPGFEAELTGGNFGAWGVAGSVTGGITDTLAGRLYVAARQRDGFYDVNTGVGPRTTTDDQNQDFWTVRGQLLLLPSDTVSIRAIADYSRREEYCCTAVQIRSGPTAALVNALSGGNGVRPSVTGGAFGPAPGYQYLPFSRTGFTNRDTGQEIEDMGLSVEANIDLEAFGGSTLTSITGVRSWSAVNGMDIDFSGMDLLYRNQDGDYGFSLDTLSQEFRLAGSTDRLDWLVGGYFSTEDLSRQDSYYFGSAYANYLSLLLTTTAPGGPYTGRIGCLTAGAPFNSAAAIGGCVVGVVAPSGPTFTPGQGVRDNYSVESDTFALFTHNTVHLSDALDLTVGLRWTRDEKVLSGLQDNINGNGSICALTAGNAAAIAGAFGAAAGQQAVGVMCLPWTNFAFDNRALSESYSEDAFSGTINLSYDVNDDLMIYGSYSRGYKGAGFNLDRVQTGITPDASLFFPAETVDSYELGLKSTLLDGSMLFNATAFHQTFSDFQLNTFLGTAFVVESVPEVTSVGLDLDMIWFTPVDGLSFQGGLTYAQTEYSSFTAADLSNPARFGPLSLLPGNTMSFAPEWSATGSVSYEREIGSGLMAGFNLSAKYTSEFNTKSDLLPAGIQQAMTLLNGRVSLGSADDRWTLELWGQNLTDEEYYQVVFNAPLQGTAFQSTVQPNGTYYNPALDTQTYNAFLGQPRTWGVTLRVSY
ncbi:MAG TPA: TonB-dependent receptor [Brevundimonas sp.]|jgi:iron complex outermembrane receptor protein|uniref:TonB-dependent receptor n=1 Tax=Brevundimonas sp. TaxID=1871086 RepID=UPI002BC11A86|nr:TonB-dependent receptor [Brevundimonas sp.]HRH19767.1 TonB-dependent receptor [Brevundimonas sp.]